MSRTMKITSIELSGEPLDERQFQRLMSALDEAACTMLDLLEEEQIAARRLELDDGPSPNGPSPGEIQ